jgi:lipopolysaccharide/colanic/teichoic acid biosynthesis glycosyltransferase
MNGRPFRMFKLRSMIPHADRNGVDSTAADDPRLTQVGKIIRRLKVDELPQFWNVLFGQMSIVGPRPNVRRETQLYTATELRLLDCPPGITDLSSIVFSDYSEILQGTSDPDIVYNQTIRPWKSRLGLLYADAPWSLTRDVNIVFLTCAAVISRTYARTRVTVLARRLGADVELLQVLPRTKPLPAAPPPGANAVVTSRSANALGGPSSDDTRRSEASR